MIRQSMIRPTTIRKRGIRISFIGSPPLACPKAAYPEHKLVQKMPEDVPQPAPPIPAAQSQPDAATPADHSAPATPFGTARNIHPAIAANPASTARSSLWQKLCLGRNILAHQDTIDCLNFVHRIR